MIKILFFKDIWEKSHVRDNKTKTNTHYKKHRREKMSRWNEFLFNLHFIANGYVKHSFIYCLFFFKKFCQTIIDFFSLYSFRLVLCLFNISTRVCLSHWRNVSINKCTWMHCINDILSISLSGLDSTWKQKQQKTIISNKKKKGYFVIIFFFFL